MKTDQLCEDAFNQKFIQQDHNDQDIVYLKARHKWETAGRGAYRAKLFELSSEAYKGTTFEKKHYSIQLNNRP